MRKVIFAVAAVVAAGALYFFLQGDGAGSDAGSAMNASNPRSALAAPTDDEQAASIDREHPGYVVYTRRGCNVCHGPGLAGTNMGPSLLDSHEHWEAEPFGRYLANPDSSVRADERLQELDAEYSMFVMPGYRLEAEELDSLTSFILSARP